MASLDRVQLELQDGSLELAVERTERDPAAELAKLWEKF